MAGLTNFDELRDEVQQWLEREGDPSLVARLDTIIQLAQANFNRKLRGYQREVSASLTTDANGKVALPAGLASVKSVTYFGRPYRYALSGATLTVSSGANRAFDVVYMGSLVSLSANNPTNWLLDMAPDAYLYACLAQAAVFMEQVQMASLYASQAQSIVDDLNLQSTAAQYGNASLTIAVQVP